MAKLGKWVAKLVVGRLLAAAALWVRIQTSLRNKKIHIDCKATREEVKKIR
jgi:hypothetical protein